MIWTMNPTNPIDIGKLLAFQEALSFLFEMCNYANIALHILAVTKGRKIDLYLFVWCVFARDKPVAQHIPEKDFAGNFLIRFAPSRCSRYLQFRSIQPLMLDFSALLNSNTLKIITF